VLFADIELAARVERAEASLLRECAAVVAERRPATGVVTLPLAGGVATYTGPGSPLNKVAGLGFDADWDDAELDAVEAAFEPTGTPVQVELSVLADPRCGARLTERGYVLRGFENVLGCALQDRGALPPVAGVEIAASGADTFAAWLDAIVTGFAHPDTRGVESQESFPRADLERVVADMVAANGFHRFLARRAGELAGGASLRLHGRVAQLCGAATLPDHRGRGVQTALLGHRLDLAARRGCELAVMTTLPGSTSQRNGQRQGFELLYSRAILVRAADEAGG
jgi:GNAT superfamily N-acetyltransferase